MRYLLLLCIIAVFHTSINPAFSQKRDLTLEDIFLRPASIYPSSVKQLQWQPQTDNYLMVQDNDILQVNAKTNASKTILNLGKINEKLQAKFTLIPSFEALPNNLLLFSISNGYLVYDMLSETFIKKIKLHEKASNNDFHKNTFQVAYTRDSNLYVLSRETEHKITTDGGNGIAYGVAVHRNEFGINKGTFWSPNGNLLAFYRMDETMVTNYPLVDVTSRIATLKNIKYPMAGMTSHQVKVGIYNCKTGETMYLETGKPLDQYLTNIAWSTDEKSVFIAVVNREQNHLWMNQYDAETGKYVRTLFEETDARYVEPLKPMFFLPDNSGRFLWESRRDGFNHLYLYDLDGKLIKQLTKGNWEVLELLDVNMATGEVFFDSNLTSPLESHLCKVNMKSGKITRLTSSGGVHNSLVSDGGKFILDTYSSGTVPKNTDLLQGDGKFIKNLFTSPNPLKDFALGESITSSILADDGKTPLYYRLVKPVNFDPSKKYPVIVYVYGGPHAQMVYNRWADRNELWQQYMAKLGYVCFTLDNRGSANRGRDFENIIHRQCGVTEMRDQMAGIRFLKQLGYTDTTRIGLHGWSYGGFMTTSLMLTYPGTIKVGVAGGPVIDWSLYEVMYGERYMDTPQENPEGYAKTSCFDKTSKLQGKLLIIHGGQDPTVVWQNSLMFIENCIKNNKKVDYFVYPTHEHNVLGKDRLHLMQKVTDYFADYL